MKKNTLISLIIISISLLIIACSKSGSGSDDTESVEIVEYKTNTPVSGATVLLIKCTDYDLVFGCQQVGVFQTYSTDANGIARIARTDYMNANQGIEVSKSQYWTQPVNAGRNEICREGWIALHITRTSTYPAGAWFQLYNTEERTVLTSSAGKLVFSAKIMDDTLVTIRAYGAEQNTVRWRVVADIIPFAAEYASGSLPPINVPALQTVTSTLNY